MSAPDRHTTSATHSSTLERAIERVDVLVVGAGISGIGTAYHLQVQRPERSFVVLEEQDGFGGTWRTHRYPGIRSDSDLYTFGYRFKPWTGAPIATAAEITDYLDEVIEENSLGSRIRYRRRVESAAWTSDDRRWLVVARRTDTNEIEGFSANFLWMCQGYYRHAEGFTPEWPEMATYRGRVVHPQTWPEDLDLEGKTAIVIGSGATAATLVPAIAERCRHVTIVQRSPTYYFTGENRSELADQLRALDVPDEWTHEIVRRQNLANLRMLTQLCFDEPEFAREELIKLVRDQLPEGFDVEKHFAPRYRPWRQRLAYLPDGDLFRAISAGKVSMVTDEIKRFYEDGVVLKSGESLPADLIITATGFHLSVLGDVVFTVDEEPVDFADTVTYRGIMFTGVPNMAWVFGYLRASWTLRVDLVGDFVCRLLAHMDEINATQVTPQLRTHEVDAERLSWVDPENFNAGYMMRAMDEMPHRLDAPEWGHSQDYWMERESLPQADLDDGCLRYR